jgi:hypothetical protein
MSECVCERERVSECVSEWVLACHQLVLMVDGSVPHRRSPITPSLPHSEEHEWQQDNKREETQR